jgi:hypothetical protein
MGKPSYCLVLSVVAMIGLGDAGSALVAAEDRGPFPLVVVVDDKAQILPRVLDQAEKEAARIYWQAGVKAEWLTPSALTRSSGDDENLPPARQVFTVRLIIQAHLRATRTSTSAFLMGAAPATSDDCGGAVYVFYDQVSGFSNVQRMDSALVLGTVIAHEIGHLLLRHDGHSEGLMRASWGSSDWHRASSGFLLFTPPDGATIRTTISSCRYRRTSSGG